jgi:hypothetical protein
MNRARRWLIPAAILVLVLSAARAQAGDRKARLASLPDTILWAWEHPEDLRSIDPRRVGVAYLALTLRLEQGTIVRQPRQQPLRVAAGTRRVAVVRIETGQQPALTAATVEDLTQDIRHLVRPGVAAIQLDYDAARSERGFYHDLAARLRQSLPDSLPISMTALASWCVDDPWLKSMPVDEIVPMVFRMGEGGGAIRRALAARGDFPCVECRGSIGLATDEPRPRLPGARRTYWFHGGSWNRRAAPSEDRAR